MPITPHANGEPLLMWSSFLSQFAMILLVVWSAIGDGSALTTTKTSSNLLNDDTYRCVCAGNCVIHPDK